MGEREELSVGSFRATFTDVTLPFGLVVDEVLLHAAAARLQRDPFGIKLDEPGSVVVTVGKANLEKFLNDQSPGGLRDFEVILRGGKLIVEATVKVLLKATAVCTLRIEGGRTLWIDLESVEMLGVGVKTLVKSQLEKLNPIVDVADFPVDIELMRTEADGDVLTLFGKARPKASASEPAESRG